jgi:hypothetical protein
MTNLLQNYYNRPSEYKKGQVWSCRDIDEKIVITDDDEYLTGIGIVRGMVLSKEFYLSDKKDLVYTPSDKLKVAIPTKRVLLRITDGPIPVNSLSLYIGDVPDSLTKKIKSPTVTTPEFNPVQEEYASRLLLKLRPLREKALTISEEFSKAELVRQTASAFLILKLLQKRANRIRLAVTMDDSKMSKEIEGFWRDERKSNSHKLLEEQNSNIRLSVVNGRLYLVSYSDSFKKLSSIQILGKGKVIKAIDKVLNFSKNNGRVFTSFEDTEKLTAGEWKVELKIDGKSKTFSFIVE